MDNQLLAHVGGEILVVGALAFYFHKQNSELHQEIAMLKNTCRELAAAVEELQESVGQIGMVLGGSRPQRPRPLAPASAQPPTPAQTPLATTPLYSKPAAPAPAHSHHHSHHKKPNRKSKLRKHVTVESDSSSSSSSSSEEHTFNDNDLDKELQSEINELDTHRDRGVECQGDVCSIKI